MTTVVDRPVRQRLDLPISLLYPISIEEANDFLVRVDHKLGPDDRPFGQEAYGFKVRNNLVSVAMSGSIVGSTSAGYPMKQVVELTRLASTEKWMNRVMLRLWRELCGPRWAYWPVKAAVSYSHNAMHRGDIYRFDGWEKVTETAGSSGGGLGRRRDRRPIPGSGRRLSGFGGMSLSQAPSSLKS